jgi:hypothetical protein
MNGGTTMMPSDIGVHNGGGVDHPDVLQSPTPLQAAVVKECERIILLLMGPENMLEERERAGMTLDDLSEAHPREVVAAGGVHAAASVMRLDASDGGSLKLRAIGAAVMANLCVSEGNAVIRTMEAMVSTAGAFILSEDPATLCDACTVLCHAARIETWGPCFESELMVKRIGALTFDLCCAMNGPLVNRSTDQERLAAKCFE